MPTKVLATERYTQRDTHRDKGIDTSKDGDGDRG